MALINCDECGHRISDKSIFCPSCGYPTHLNKALREKAPKDDSHHSVNVEVKSSVKSEMSDKDVEKIITPNIVAEPISSNGANGKKADMSVDKKSPAANIGDETPAEVQSEQQSEATVTSTEDVNDALAEYEATLGKQITPETNKRNKLILYFSVLVVLLAAIGGCYYYAKSNHLQSIDEVECEPVEEVLEEEVTDIIPNDSVAAAIAADSINVTTSATTNVPAASNTAPQAQPTAPAANQEAPAVQQSPAVRQL